MGAPQRTAIWTAVAFLLVGLWAGSSLAREEAPDRTIQLYQRMLQRNPRDARTYHRLGDAYIQKARQTGDITYFTLAEASLRKALELAPEFSGASRHLAFVLYSRHAFEEAAIQAQKAIALDSRDSHAYGILGDAYLEIGKYRLAQEAYERMIQIQKDLHSYSRLAGLRSMRGQTKAAIEDLERAIQDGHTSGHPKESVAWVQWQLGNEYLALGKLKEAEAQYLEALKTYPNYYRASAGLAQVRTAQQRYPEAIELYQKALAIIPLPEYAGALGDVYTKVGRFQDAKKQYDLVEYIGELNALNHILYNRELAYFYADHDMKLMQSLDLARKELEYRHDIYANDVLAWALYKNGNLQEARSAMTEALKLGTKDARLFFHAGMIHHRLGEYETAKAYLQRALSTNPHFHIFHAEVAERTLKDLESRPGPSQAQEKSDGR